MSCCGTSKKNSINDFHDLEDYSSSEKEKSSGCCGKKVSQCLTKKTFATAAVVVGVILLVFGALGLMAHFTPAACNSSVMLNIKSAALAFAAKVGSDLLTLTIFTTSFGAGFVLCGTVGLIVDKCQASKAKEEEVDGDLLLDFDEAL